MTSRVESLPSDPRSSAADQRRTRRVTRWLVALLLVLAAAWLLQASIDPIDVAVTIDGDEVFAGQHTTIGERFMLFVCAAAFFVVALLTAGLILPVLLAALVVVGLVIAAIVLLSVVGPPLLVIALMALLLSPFLLLGWLVWKLVS